MKNKSFLCRLPGYVMMLLPLLAVARPIRNMPYFEVILGLILLLAAVLGFFIGSSLALIAAAAIQLSRDQSSLAQKKIIWIGGLSGSVILMLVSVYLVLY